MRHSVRQILALILIVILLAACTGQSPQIELPETYNENGLSFNYPSGWIVNQAAQATSINLSDTTSPQIQLQVSPLVTFQQYAIMGLGTTLNELVATHVGIWQQIMSPVLGVMSSEVSTPESASVTEFTVNNLPAAYASGIIQMDSENSLGMTIAAVNLGNNLVVTFTVQTQQTDTATFEQYQAAVLAVANTARYSLPPTPANTQTFLPTAFSAQVGSLQTGLLSFFYPENWYATGANLIILQNYVGQPDGILETGQMLAFIFPPDASLVFLVAPQSRQQCSYDLTTITPAAVVESLIAPERFPQPTTVDEVQTYDLDGKDAAAVHFTQTTQEGLAIAVDFGVGNVVSMMASAPTGELQQYEETLFAIAETFEYTPSQGCGISA
jgi:hypothetical protein